MYNMYGSTWPYCSKMQTALDFVFANPRVSALMLFAAATGLWLGWDLHVRPGLVPQAEIRRMADRLVEAHGERAEEAAFIEEDSAWRRSDCYGQGLWRRVGRELRRRG